MAPDDLKRLTQKIRDQLEESITQKVTQQLMMSFSQMQPQIQSHGLALPPEAEVGAFAARVSIKKSCVDPSRQDRKMGDSNKGGLYVNDSLPQLVALGRVYEGSMTVHNVPLGKDQVKVGIEEL